MADAGEVTGESPEVANVVVSRLGIERISWRQVPSGALMGELEEGPVDVVAAGMFITADRARRVAFSDPTFRVRPGLLLARGNPKRIRSFARAAKALSSPTVRWMALREQLGRTQAVDLTDAASGVPGHFGCGGFAFRRRDRRLVQAWNAQPRSYLGTPAHRDLVAALGFTEAELPRGLAAAAVLAGGSWP